MSTKRKMDTKVCSKCGKVKLFSEFSKDKNRKDGYYPRCKYCVKEYHENNLEKHKNRTAKYRAANSETLKVKKAEYQTNSDKHKDYQAKYRASHSEKMKAYNAEYQKENPEKVNAINSKRRSAKLLAIPSWLTKDDYKAIEAIYTEAKRLEAETGLIYHVDHIHPLQGKLVCGLHCPANLQILTDIENCTKGIKFTPYVESES